MVPLRVLMLFVFITAGSRVGYSQPLLEENLREKIAGAGSDSERIVRLGQLADYYYANKDFDRGDSLIEKQFMLAGASLSQNLNILAYFTNPGYRSTGVSTTNRSKNAINYIKRALAYAKEHDLPDYMALAYSNLSAIYNTDGALEEAFKNASLAFTTALNTPNDSAKVICAIQLGNTYLQRSDILMAFRTYNNAQNIAVQKGKEYLLPPVFHAMGVLYKRLDKIEASKEYIFRSLAINKKRNHAKGMINDYIFLAKLSNYSAGKEYLQEALLLATNSQDVPLRIEAGRILFSHMMLQEKPPVMLAYLEENPEIKNVFINTGPHYLDWMLAEIYFYGGAPDSALTYFRLAEPAFISGYDLNSRKNFFSEYASCLQALERIPEAIDGYIRSAELARSASDLRSLKAFASELKDLYRLQGDYRRAFEYSVLFDNYKDSVDLLSREKDIALLELANEEKEQQQQAELAAESQRRRHNLQYMLITIIIATVFVLLIMVGMFRVSAFTIRLMGFFSLIFLFEFIILLLDTWIHHLTHGEPWKIWIIKIGIISIILPVHHFLEHKLIHYLMSHHLIALRSRIRLFPFVKRKKKSPPHKEAGEIDSENSGGVS